jgi:hypothetical protein
MSKEFYISANRRVVVKNQDGDYIIIIEEIGSELKTVKFPAKRWAQLVAIEYYIDQSINKLLAKEEKVSFQTQIGGGIYVSVTSGFECVDIREFYFDKNKGFPCPSRRGIALRVMEWEKLKQTFHEIRSKFPALSAIQPCSEGTDHYNQECALSCRERQPFRYEEELFSQKIIP